VQQLDNKVFDLHFSCDNINVTGMNTLGLRALFAVNDKVCRLGHWYSYDLAEQPDYRESGIIRTGGLSGQPDYWDSRIIGKWNLSFAPCHKYL